MVSPPSNPGGPLQSSAQLAEGLRSAIDSGEYQIGDMLPSVRELSKVHKLSTTTVQRALAALREEGLIQPWDRKGTIVLRKPSQPQPDIAGVGVEPAVIQQIFARLDNLLELHTDISQRLAKLEEERPRQAKPRRDA